MHISDGGPEFSPLLSSFRGLLILEEESIGGLLLKGTPLRRCHKKWKRDIMKTNQHRSRIHRLTAAPDIILLGGAGPQQAQMPKSYHG
jgi:hypothetical protein